MNIEQNLGEYKIQFKLDTTEAKEKIKVFCQDMKIMVNDLRDLGIKPRTIRAILKDTLNIVKNDKQDEKGE